MVPGKILVATDFSEPSRVALDWAVDLAKPLEAQVTVAHVFDVPIVGLLDASILVDATTAARLSDAAQTSLDADVAHVRARGISADGLLRQGDPREEIPLLAENLGADLIVVGSHGRRGRLARALIGSVAERILRTSVVPVAVIHRHA
jgi:nucleotide-binding universal stress UspA family protein